MSSSRHNNVSIIDSHKIGAKSVVDANALVAKYEVLIQEKAPSQLSQERAYLLFEVMRSVLPHFGIFRPLLSVVTDEMFELIFSQEHLTSEHASITRVPYFFVLDRLSKEEESKKSQNNQEKEMLHESLFKKNAQFEEAMEAIASRNAEIAELQDSLSHYKELSERQASEIDKLSGELEAVHTSSDEAGGQLKRQIMRLESALAERNIEVEYLQDFKEGYTETSEAFRENILVTDMSAPKVRRSVEYSKREELIGDLQTAVKMEEDILNITNTIIDQFDEFMEDHQDVLASKSMAPTDDPVKARAVDRDMEQAEQDLWNTQETFRRNMGDLDTELGLIRKHTMMLEEKLDRTLQEEREIKLARQRNRRLAAERRREAEEPSKASSDSVGLRDTEDKIGMNPFIPYERVFSKYAVQLYYSQDEGKTFFLHQNCQLCESCGDKTVACPHKVMKETEFPMPHKVTHLKLIRPSVKLTKDFLEEAKAPPTASTVIRMASGLRGFSARHRNQTRSTASAGFPTTPMTAASTAAISALMKYPLVKVWDEFKMRSTEMRQIHRTLTRERVEMLLEQFLVHVIWNDNHGVSGNYCNIMDSLFNFFSNRYITDEARNYAVQDFLAGLLLYESDSKFLALFAHALVGNIDLSVIRYLLLVADLINSVSFRHLEDFRIFLGALHPLLHEDDLDSFQMGFTSYGDNKISAHSVYDYILFMVFKGREPLFLEMEQQVSQYPARTSGLMTDEEFTDVIDQVLQLGDEKIKRRLFGEAEAAINTDPYVETQIPMERLAHMLAYMHTAESFSRMHETLLVEMKKHHESLDDSLKEEVEEVPLMCMSGVELMGYSIAKRDAFRKG